MSAPKKQFINLLPQEEFASSTFGRIIAWILSTFRVIVVITEIVVMSAFASRFILDARLSDLNRQIKEQSAVIESFSSFEKEFRGYQSKSKIASEIFTSQQLVADKLSTITSLVPPDTSLSSFSFSEKDINLRGLSESELSISQLMANLKGARFENIILNQINSDSSGRFNFLIAVGKQKE